MKRHGNLWDGMISFENLLRAAEKARRGKRFRPAAARFFFHLERELTRLHEELASQDLPPRSLPHVHDLRGQDPADQRRAVPRSGGASRPDRRAGADLRAVLHLRQLRLPQGKGHPRRRRPLPAVCPPLPLRPEGRRPQVLPIDRPRRSSRT